MNQNPVASVNILLSTNRKNIEKFALSGKIPEPEKGSYLFTSLNTNFLSLDHNVMGDNDFQLELKIQDPDDGFIKYVLPNNVRDFMENTVTDKKKNEFFIMYGLGGVPIRHWAGPLRAYLIGFDHYSSDDGSDVAELTFVPSLEMYSELNQQTLTRHSASPYPRYVQWAASQILGTTIAKSAYTGVWSGDALGYKLGETKISTKMWNGKTVPWGVSAEDLLDGIRSVFTTYAKSWGVSNLILFLTKEFKDILVTETIKDPRIAFANPLVNKRLLGSGLPGEDTSIIQPKYSGVVVQLFGNSLRKMQIFLSQFGLDITVVPMDPSEGDKDNQMFEIYIDINSAYKETDSFMDVFHTFYNSLQSLSNTVQGPTYMVEQNLEVIKILKKSYGDNITDDTEPLVIIGDRNFIWENVYARKDITTGLSPLEKEVMRDKQAMRKYYNERISHKYTNNYFLDLGKGDPYDLPTPAPGDEGVLTFEANTEKSNLISYNFDSNPFTLAAIKRRLGVGVGSNVSFDNLKEYIESRLDSSVPGAEWWEINGVAGEIAKVLQTTTIGKRISIPDPTNWKPAVDAYMKYFIDVAVMKGITGHVVTIPLFQYSDQFALASVCEVKINKNPSLNDYPPGVDQSTFYNGTYKIIGFRHTITGSDAKSEFNIVKIGLPEKGSLNAWSEARSKSKVW